jgi:hypothetical protein
MVHRGGAGSRRGPASRMQRTGHGKTRRSSGRHTWSGSPSRAVSCRRGRLAHTCVLRPPKSHLPAPSYRDRRRFRSHRPFRLLPSQALRIIATPRADDRYVHTTRGRIVASMQRGLSLAGELTRAYGVGPPTKLGRTKGSASGPRYRPTGLPRQCLRIPGTRRPSS